MNTITRDELITRLERREPTQLVMALGKWAYEQVRIPGSLLLGDVRQASETLSREREIIIYCANEACPASYRAYYHLKSLGYTQIKRFAGGLEAWVEAGLPVEGRLSAAAS